MAIMGSIDEVDTGGKFDGLKNISDIRHGPHADRHRIY